MITRKPFIFLGCTFLLVMLFTLSAMADSWALPEKRTVCSANGKYCLEVIPKKLESQLSYFQDKVDGKPNAGADKRATKNFARGIFYSLRQNRSRERVWETRLVNEVAPVSVLVSDQGDYVITFDNWHGVGYGDDVVAIYKASDGMLAKKLGLSDFLTDSDINELPSSVSSIWWGGKHWIDDKNGQLVLEVTKGKPGYEKDAEFFQVRIDLSTGTVLDEKHDRLPSLQFVIQPIEEAVKSNIVIPCFDSTTAILTPSIDLLKKAIKREGPVYPPAARAVRATGKVAVALRVGADGSTECASAISGHPLLRAAITNALKAWKFEKSQDGFAGFLIFEGTWALVAPDGTVIKDAR